MSTIYKLITDYLPDLKERIIDVLDIGANPISGDIKFQLILLFREWYNLIQYWIDHGPDENITKFLPEVI